MRNITRIFENSHCQQKNANFCCSNSVFSSSNKHVGHLFVQGQVLAKALSTAATYVGETIIIYADVGVGLTSIIESSWSHPRATRRAAQCLVTGTCQLHSEKIFRSPYLCRGEVDGSCCCSEHSGNSCLLSL